jgi:hypothetical protein
MISGAPHGEGTRWATPNCLEASFKSNKRESINQSHHRCFLRGRSEELSQRGQILHLKCLSHPNPRSNPCLECLEGSWERGIEALEVFQWKGRRSPREEEEGIYIPELPKIVVMCCLRPGRVTRHGWTGHPAPSRVVPGHPATHAGWPGKAGRARLS